MPEWNVDVDDADAQARLKAFASLLLDLRPFWPKVVPLFVGWMQEQFATQGAYWLGAPWAPLSPAYAARKAVLHPGKGILVAEGDLRREASYPQRQATPTSLTLSIRWRKKKQGKVLDPRWHQFGTDKMPARPLLAGSLPLDAQLELQKVADEYVEEMARRVGLLN